jgi:tRNA-dihydrouridine synthase 1
MFLFYVTMKSYLNHVFKRDAAQYTDKDIEDLVVVDQATGLKIYPHWVAQPYFRVGPQKEAPVEQS